MQRQRRKLTVEERVAVARQSKPLVQRQSAIHPMVEQRSVGKLMSGPQPPKAVARRARLCAGHAQQLGGESPPYNLMEVKYERSARAEPRGTRKRDRDPTNRNRI
jgi:hypothetical protein